MGDGYIPDSERKRKWKSFNYKSLPILQDVQRMTAALLIENIDVAFETWDWVCEEGSVTGEDFGSSYTYLVGEVYILWHLLYILWGGK